MTGRSSSNGNLGGQSGDHVRRATDRQRGARSGCRGTSGRAAGVGRGVAPARLAARSRSEVERLSRRTDVHGIAYFLGHYALIGLGGWLCWMTFPGPLFWPVFAFQAVVTGFLFSPLHECAHGAAFRTRALNEAALWITGFVYIVPPYFFRYFHLGHHRFTQVPGKDPLPRAARARELPAVPLVLRRAVVLVAEPLVDGQARLRFRAPGQCGLRAGQPARADGARVPHHGDALRGAPRCGGAFRLPVGAGGRLGCASRRR